MNKKPFCFHKSRIAEPHHGHVGAKESNNFWHFCRKCTELTTLKCLSYNRNHVKKT